VGGRKIRGFNETVPLAVSRHLSLDRGQSADAIIIISPTPAGTGNNVVFNLQPPNQTGTTIFGNINDPNNTLVQFRSTQTLTTPSGGQAGLGKTSSTLQPQTANSFLASRPRSAWTT
jgi:hypothetical protein